MAIVKRKISQNQAPALPYVDGLYPASPDDAISSAISNATAATLEGGVVYVDPAKGAILNGQTERSEPVTPQIDEGLWLKDIAQSHHYTVWLAGMEGMSSLQVPRSPLTKDLGFLPVKTMNLKYTSYENMSIPVAIFGDFPLLNKKRVSTIDLSCYDYDNNKLEYELRKWEASCFPQGRYVAYMSRVAREFRYRGYSVDGRLTLEYRVFVIPAGNITISRDYSANEAKMVNFSLVMVGDGQTCAAGKAKEPSQERISDSSGISELNGDNRGDGYLKARIWYNHQV